MFKIKTHHLWIFIIWTGCQMLRTQPLRLQSEQLGTGGLSFELWNANRQTLSQFAMPLTYIFPYSDKVRIYAVTSPALSTWSHDVHAQMAGLSDIKMGGHILTMNDKLLITFGFNIAVGKENLNVEESSVAAHLANPALDFSVPCLGQGADLQIGASRAGEWGDFIVGYGLTFIMKGSYRPLKIYDARYEPGNEISLTGGLSREARIFNRDMNITADMLYSIYSNDQFGNTRFLSSGNRMLIQLMSQFREGPLDMIVFIRDRIKGKNEHFIEQNRDGTHGNQFELQVYGYHEMRKNLRVHGLTDMKLFASNKSGTGGARLIGIGGGFRKQISRQLASNGEIRVYTGSLKTGAEWFGAFGLKIFGGVTYTF